MNTHAFCYRNLHVWSWVCLRPPHGCFHTAILKKPPNSIIHLAPRISDKVGLWKELIFIKNLVCARFGSKSHINLFILLPILRGRHIYHPSFFIVEATEAQKSRNSKVLASNSEFEPRQCGSWKVTIVTHTASFLLLQLLPLFYRWKFWKLQVKSFLSNIKFLCGLGQVI